MSQRKPLLIISEDKTSNVQPKLGVGLIKTHQIQGPVSQPILVKIWDQENVSMTVIIKLNKELYRYLSKPVDNIRINELMAIQKAMSSVNVNVINRWIYH